MSETKPKTKKTTKPKATPKPAPQPVVETPTDEVVEPKRVEKAEPKQLRVYMNKTIGTSVATRQATYRYTVDEAELAEMPEGSYNILNPDYQRG